MKKLIYILPILLFACSTEEPIEQIDLTTTSDFKVYLNETCDSNELKEFMVSEQTHNRVMHEVSEGGDCVFLDIPTYIYGRKTGYYGGEDSPN